MDQKIAVLFMPDNIACTEEKTPLMLQPILFCPVLTWMCAELCGRGIERLFICLRRLRAGADEALSAQGRGRHLC